jgi:hypothetical protein
MEPRQVFLEAQKRKASHEGHEGSHEGVLVNGRAGPTECALVIGTFGINGFSHRWEHRPSGR